MVVVRTLRGKLKLKLLALNSLFFLWPLHSLVLQYKNIALLQYTFTQSFFIL